MHSKATYKTKQRECLLRYLEEKPGVHVTVNELYRHFKNRGITIGQCTIYRHLERMVDEGLVNKYVFDGNSPACFEYLAESERSESNSCFRCKCEKCGKLIQLHCVELAGVQGHMLEVHQFTLNPKRTVFYGLCADCASQSV